MKHMKQTKHHACAVALAAMAAVALMAAPALAEVTEDAWYLEGGLGYYIGDSVKETAFGISAEMEIESDFLINFRAGTFLTETWGLEGQLWFAPTETTATITVPGFPLLSGSVSKDTDVLGLDASAVYCTNPSGKHNFFVVGGVGMVDIDENSFTLHLGAAVRINVTDNFYVRPDARYLHVNDVAGDSLNNFLITVSAGWVFGK